MREFTKSQKRHFRELINSGYERELAAALGKLNRHFARWKQGEIDPFELTEFIHKFDHGPARSSTTTTRQPQPNSLHFAVAGLAMNGTITLEEIHQDIRPIVEAVMQAYGHLEKDRRGVQEASTTDPENEPPEEDEEEDQERNKAR